MATTTRPRPASAPPPAPPPTKRCSCCVAGHPDRPNQTGARRVEVASGQKPFPIVVTRPDSRVSPELYFDQGLGDLCVVRDAGHTLNDHAIGSIEYAVEHLHTSIIIVVGHEKCGGGILPGRIGTLVEAIRPAVQETRNQTGDKVDNAIRGNSRRVATVLINAQAWQSGTVKVFAARHDLASGKVELLP